MSRTPAPPDVEPFTFTSTLPVPGAPLPEPPATQPALGHELLANNALLDAIERGVAHAFAAKDPCAYMEALATRKPELFYKFCQLVIDAKLKAQGNNALGRMSPIITALPASMLDRPPPE